MPTFNETGSACDKYEQVRVLSGIRAAPADSNDMAGRRSDEQGLV